MSEESNSSRGEKDLAAEEKRNFEERVKELIKQLEPNESEPIDDTDLLVHNINGKKCIITLDGQALVTINSDGTFQYNLDKAAEFFSQEGQSLKERLKGNDLPRLIDAVEQEKAQVKKSTDNKGVKQRKQDDTKPKLEDESGDPLKEEIARKYNVAGNKVIHLAMADADKVTKNKNFSQLLPVAQRKGYTDIFIIPGADEHSNKFIGIKGDTDEEIEEMEDAQIKGKNPLDITIDVVKDEEITEIKPKAMYQIEEPGIAIAIIEPEEEYGGRSAVYCRQNGDDPKRYVGIIIPEAEGKNIRQQGAEARELTDPQKKSRRDVSEVEAAFQKQQHLEEKQEMPSYKFGVQVYEIISEKQQEQLNIKAITEDLMEKDGIKDKGTVFPGKYEQKATRILKKLEDDPELTYDNAIEEVEAEAKRQAPPGGPQPGVGRFDKQQP